MKTKSNMCMAVAVLSAAIACGDLTVSNLGSDVGETVIEQTSRVTGTAWGTSGSTPNLRGQLLAGTMINTNYNITSIKLAANNTTTMTGDLSVEILKIDVAPGSDEVTATAGYVNGTMTSLFADSVSNPGVAVVNNNWFEIDLGTSVEFEEGCSYAFRVGLVNQATPLHLKRDNDVVSGQRFVADGSVYLNQELSYGLGGAAVPEPATLGLVTIFGMGILCTRRFVRM